MLNDILNTSAAPTFDNCITKVEVHTYNPYANAALGNNDQIRIPIHQQNLYTLPCQSFLYVEGKLTFSGCTKRHYMGFCEDYKRVVKNSRHELIDNIPHSTTAYCLVIHDRIVEYNRLTNVVRKIM
ncbi:hypothetical protein WN55_05453 [Dufourea novaeangliae]|uniref:Uncharacterized protein n=1 Tax=Dufourea novaeangliae TaxID=178035 RepID=A0A154P0R1_DUFNO|nr:hypothetical protein WN55_05453 [Dufourea novaeangliae]